jgi:hypothetical protein
MSAAVSEPLRWRPGLLPRGRGTRGDGALVRAGEPHLQLEVSKDRCDTDPRPPGHQRADEPARIAITRTLPTGIATNSNSRSCPILRTGCPCIDGMMARAFGPAGDGWRVVGRPAPAVHRTTARARKWASDELKQWRDENGRITSDEWVAALLGDRPGFTGSSGASLLK